MARALIDRETHRASFVPPCRPRQIGNELRFTKMAPLLDELAEVRRVLSLHRRAFAARVSPALLHGKSGSSSRA